MVVTKLLNSFLNKIESSHTTIKRIVAKKCEANIFLDRMYQVIN